MKDILLYNTLSRKKEIFQPLTPGKVGMYTCGPTVHDYQHVGNFRSMILSDILSRVLRFNGYEVVAVRNITDIDDKIIKKAHEAQMPIADYTRLYEEKFFDDLTSLRILPVEYTTRATEYIPQMIEFIQSLIDKGFAYREEDGSVYFDISKFPSYGKLSRLEAQQLKTGTRILSDEYTKDDVQDFALWKATGEGEEGYPSPWGQGRPGWHIECSVMSQTLLGDTLDIHVGGIDLLFPHHENEIAQSEARTGVPFVRYFVHGEHVLISDEKMSKSLKNIFTISDLSKKGIEPLAYKFFCYQTHYRQKLNFTWEAVMAAQNGYHGLRESVKRIRSKGPEKSDPGITPSPEAIQLMTQLGTEFHDAINDDLNMPRALAALFDHIGRVHKAESLSADDYTNLFEQLVSLDSVFGLDFITLNTSKDSLPFQVQDLFSLRKKAREEKNWEEADRLRTAIEKLGFCIEDTGESTTIMKK